MKLLQKIMPSSKLGNDININYNSLDTIKPIDISDISLIQSMKKKIMDLRVQNRNITIEKSQKKLALIVPYRHREEHLKKFLPYTIDYLNKQKIEFEIIIVEQSDSLPFNRAKLMNVGVLKASNDCDYFIFHDVDLLAENIDYRYCNHTQKLFTFIKEDGEDKKYGATIFGGAILVPKKIFFDINGFSNNYWQWGKEDDDFLLRHLLKGYIPLQDTHGRFLGLPHQPSITRSTSGEYVTDAKLLKQNKLMYKKNKKTFSYFKRGISNQDEDGINNIKDYTIEEVVKDKNIVRVKVSFSQSFDDA